VAKSDQARFWKTDNFKISLTSNLIVALIASAITAFATWITASHFNSTQPQVVTYKLEYQNGSSKQQGNVLIIVSIPSGSEYVMGSTYIASSETQANWQHTNDGITGHGLNIGSYAPGGNAYLKFQVRPRGKVTFTCSSGGDIGGVTVSDENSVKLWVTC
jgi:hypothetical protein